MCAKQIVVRSKFTNHKSKIGSWSGIVCRRSHRCPQLRELKMFPAYERRDWLKRSGLSFGAAALASLLGEDGFAASPQPHHAPKARSIIYLFMHGGPSQVDLFDHKPRLREWHGQELPASVRGTQRLTGMTSG